MGIDPSTIALIGDILMFFGAVLVLLSNPPSSIALAMMVGGFLIILIAFSQMIMPYSLYIRKKV